MSDAVVTELHPKSTLEHLADLAETTARIAASNATLLVENTELRIELLNVRRAAQEQGVTL